jgi:hypothetical protein
MSLFEKTKPISENKNEHKCLFNNKLCDNQHFRAERKQSQFKANDRVFDGNPKQNE